MRGLRAVLALLLLVPAGALAHGTRTEETAFAGPYRVVFISHETLHATEWVELSFNVTDRETNETVRPDDRSAGFTFRGADGEVVDRRTERPEISGSWQIVRTTIPGEARRMEIDLTLNGSVVRFTQDVVPAGSDEGPSDRSTPWPAWTVLLAVVAAIGVRGAFRKL